MSMYHRSMLAMADQTPALLRKKFPRNSFVDTPGWSQDSTDEYEKNSFIDSQEGIDLPFPIFSLRIKFASRISRN